MLAAEDTELKAPPKPARLTGLRSRVVAIAAIVVILPMGSGVIYSALGSPQLPGKGYAWRLRHDTAFVAATAADQLAAELQQDPKPAGYRHLAQMYFNSRDYERAAAADRRAIELGSKDSVTWSELGEAVVMANGGSVAPEALLAFTNAIELDSRSERSKFYIGLSEAQIGNLRQAVAIWRDLERNSDPNALWVPMLRQHIAGFAKKGGFDPASVSPSPPSVESMNAAVAAMRNALHAQQTAAGSGAAPSGANDQDTMIRGMVAQLSARMEKNPDDVAGWQRLARAYSVLGEKEKAREAIGHAVRLKPTDVSVQLALAETQQSAAAAGNDTPADFIATMRTILKLDPENAQALYYVGLAEQRLGHTEVARGLWNKALAVTAANDPIAVRIHNGFDGLSGKKTIH
jgi:cytochrome c-type biogenesis protein CcmH